VAVVHRRYGCWVDRLSKPLQLLPSTGPHLPLLSFHCFRMSFPPKKRALFLNIPLSFTQPLISFTTICSSPLTPCTQTFSSSNLGPLRRLGQGSTLSTHAANQRQGPECIKLSNNREDVPSFPHPEGPVCPSLGLTSAPLPPTPSCLLREHGQQAPHVAIKPRYTVPPGQVPSQE